MVSLPRSYTKSLVNYLDFQYFTTLRIGSHRQELSLIFDTGSPTFWVPTSECADYSCHEANYYDYSLSSDYIKWSSEPQSIQYGSGAVHGYLSSDTVCLKSHSQNETCIQDTLFLSVFQTEDLSGMMSDGLVGLSPDSGSPLSFIGALYSQGKIESRVFAFKLAASK